MNITKHSVTIDSDNPQPVQDDVEAVVLKDTQVHLHCTAKGDFESVKWVYGSKDLETMVKGESGLDYKINSFNPYHHRGGFQCVGKTKTDKIITGVVYLKPIRPKISYNETHQKCTENDASYCHNDSQCIRRVDGDQVFEHCRCNYGFMGDRCLHPAIVVETTPTIQSVVKSPECSIGFPAAASLMGIFGIIALVLLYLKIRSRKRPTATDYDSATGQCIIDPLTAQQFLTVAGYTAKDSLIPNAVKISNVSLPMNVASSKVVLLEDSGLYHPYHPLSNGVSVVLPKRASDPVLGVHIKPNRNRKLAVSDASLDQSNEVHFFQPDSTITPAVL